ncbi:MarR family winged helix-turn-helix transcriptional regulator [Deinococcus yunweiensis]|uniref:MarR family winged helix-turn-helix transcriptional regulator n=1 Tax=Deinococcus yunweiensis TaxID=367282 RepID=UPI00398EC5B0
MKPPDGPDPGAIRSASELLGHTMRRLHKHISSQVMSSMQDELQDLDLSFSQMTALHHLRAFAPTTVTLLSEHIHLSVPAASHLLERLVQRGLVTRDENPDNRREKLIALTDAGRGVLEQMDSAFVNAYVTTFARLRPETVLAAQQHLQSLLNELETTPAMPQETP